MEEEKKVETPTNSDTGQNSRDADYLEAIRKIKENSVPRTEYDDLRAENKRLLDSIVNGADIGQPTQDEPKESIEELRSRYLRDDQTNLQYIETVLKLRQAIIDSGSPDPFLPVGSQILPTDSDIATAEKVARVLQECVDDANGDSEAFTNELQTRLVDQKIR